MYLPFDRHLESSETGTSQSREWPADEGRKPRGVVLPSEYDLSFDAQPLRVVSHTAGA